MSPKKAVHVFERISESDSPSFGEHWTLDRIAQFFAPPRESIRQVGKWLSSSGVRLPALRLSRDGTLSFNISVGKVEFHLCHPINSGTPQTASERYSLPSRVVNIMLAAFNKHYCRAGLDPQLDPVYRDQLPGGYNASDCGTYTLPRVIAIIYAWNEAWYPDAYARRLLMYCIDRDNPKNNTASEGHFALVFPAACPWVTSVGDTQFLPVAAANCCSSSTLSPFPGETALNNNSTVSFSGGGFSRVLPAPWGYLDISAMGKGFLVSLHGGYRAVSGTSASTLVVAAMIAKINDARLYASKSTVGLTHPVLYAARNRGMLRDTYNGKSHGCGVREAFPARQAWDAATLGTLDFEKLKELYLRLP
ncbi:subtilisin-like protein [Parathielavia appendiculata]|uniref:Subtilisin-like protein n=1 Tax=Parathielavia appendiculata TaxID=2587402 RepID=A0AAN6TUU0_9PEZI|nr:subtilisin-like protein [Parathielavia appendiculata]